MGCDPIYRPYYPPDEITFCVRCLKSKCECTRWQIVRSEIHYRVRFWPLELLDAGRAKAAGFLRFAASKIYPEDHPHAN